MTSTGDMLDIAQDAIESEPLEGSRWQRLEIKLRMDIAKLRTGKDPEAYQIDDDTSEEQKSSFWEGVDAAFNHVLNTMARLEMEEREPLKLDD